MRSLVFLLFCWGMGLFTWVVGYHLLDVAMITLDDKEAARAGVCFTAALVGFLFPFVERDEWSWEDLKKLFAAAMEVTVFDLRHLPPWFWFGTMLAVPLVWLALVFCPPLLRWRRDRMVQTEAYQALVIEREAQMRHLVQRGAENGRVVPLDAWRDRVAARHNAGAQNGGRAS